MRHNEYSAEYSTSQYTKTLSRICRNTYDKSFFQLTTIVSFTSFVPIIVTLLLLFQDKLLSKTIIKYEETEFSMDVNFISINKSKLGDTKLINTKLNAKNVLEVHITSSIIEEIFHYYKKYIEPHLSRRECGSSIAGKNAHEFYCEAPSWKSNIRWISVNNIDTYKYFLPYFEEIGLDQIFQPVIDVENMIVVYSIFFVVRSMVSGRNWHVDYYNGTNVNAFTLLIPLQDENLISLAYKDIDNTLKRYEYRKNVGIAFGENFVHSSNSGSSDKLEVAFCFVFGTDKLRDWRRIKKTSITQLQYYMDPILGFVSSKEN